MNKYKPVDIVERTNIFSRNSQKSNNPALISNKAGLLKIDPPKQKIEQFFWSFR